MLPDPVEPGFFLSFKWKCGELKSQFSDSRVLGFNFLPILQDSSASCTVSWGLGSHPGTVTHSCPPGADSPAAVLRLPGPLGRNPSPPGGGWHKTSEGNPIPAAPPLPQSSLLSHQPPPHKLFN